MTRGYLHRSTLPTERAKAHHKVGPEPLFLYKDKNRDKIIAKKTMIAVMSLF